MSSETTDDDIVAQLRFPQTAKGAVEGQDEHS